MLEFDDAIDEKIRWFRAWPFFLVHVAAVVGAILIPPTWPLVLLALGMYLIRMWAIIVGYHRYFSHRSFKTSRVFQFIMALIGVASVPVSEIALALLTQMSMPPKASTVCSTAAITWSSSRMSHCTGSALPPASSISFAAV